jgi:DNA-binding NarL/FixJ family response regulator
MSGRASATEETLEAASAFLTEVGGDGQPAVQAGGDTPAHVSPGTLTTRQRDVLRLLVDGLSDPEIAAALNLSTRTVETHVAGILNKLGLHSRTAAVAYAVRHRLV